MINLTKDAPSVSLTKSMGGTGPLRINLNWDQQAGSADLDLAVMYEMADGTKGVVQALGGGFGSLDAPPYVMLDADDRTGATTAGENVTVNLDRTSQIKRLLVFTFIYEGALNWAAANAVVTLHPHGTDPITIRLDESDPQARSCAIALLTPQGSGMRIQREVRYVRGVHEQIDQAFGWGMSWQQARK